MRTGNRLDCDYHTGENGSQTSSCKRDIVAHHDQLVNGKAGDSWRIARGKLYFSVRMTFRHINSGILGGYIRRTLDPTWNILELFSVRI